MENCCDFPIKIYSDKTALFLLFVLFCLFCKKKSEVNVLSTIHLFCHILITQSSPISLVSHIWYTINNNNGIMDINIKLLLLNETSQNCIPNECISKTTKIKCFVLLCVCDASNFLVYVCVCLCCFDDSFMGYYRNLR